METLTQERIKVTRATFKGFINKNAGKLWVCFKSSFDGMTDGIEQLQGNWTEAEPTTQHKEYSLGINGVWLVGNSRDWFSTYEDAIYKGIAVSNSCGYFIVGVKK